LPPGTGQALIAAKTMPGTCASIPNFADPSILWITSMRGIDVPMKVNLSGVLISGSLVSVTFAASAANSPNRSVRPEGPCVTTLEAAVHSDAGTFHRVAAAATRRSRALAPTCCILFCEPLTVRLPFENMSP
jgi:hypothetical protein